MQQPDDTGIIHLEVAVPVSHSKLWKRLKLSIGTINMILSQFFVTGEGGLTYLTLYICTFLSLRIGTSRVLCSCRSIGKIVKCRSHFICKLPASRRRKRHIRRMCACSYGVDMVVTVSAREIKTATVKPLSNAHFRTNIYSSGLSPV